LNNLQKGTTLDVQLFMEFDVNDTLMDKSWIFQIWASKLCLFARALVMLSAPIELNILLTYLLASAADACTNEIPLRKIISKGFSAKTSHRELCGSCM